ncbi:MAG: hypothetical protein PHV59_08600 [Victivallales bacterium]|nr:hypothetical protein [Victivallales bacterium]
MHYSSDNRTWNEFRWEKEIRQDDKRIRHYFHILPACLDLPGEEDSIISKLMGQPDLVPSAAGSDAENSLDIFFEDEEEPLDIIDLQGRRESDIYLKLQRLSLQWNMIMVRDLRAPLRRDGLVTACTLGKLTARSIDIIELEDARMPQFKISLLKRLLSGINEVLGQLNEYVRSQYTLKAGVDVFSESLHGIRERVIKLIEQTREAVTGNE